MASQTVAELKRKSDAAWGNLSRQLQGMEPHIDRSDAPGEWTTREVLCHLLLEAGFARAEWFHEAPLDNVRAIINLGLTKGFVGRDKCGLMPIRGHSGVQGGAEMGERRQVARGADRALRRNDRKRVGFELLGVENFISSPLHVGSGMVEMAHGRSLRVMLVPGLQMVDDAVVPCPP